MRDFMHRFWGSLALNLGKRAGLVSIIGLLVTLALGAGITKLEFATGQDSYLNKSDQVYKDNVAYQDLFGGEAMLTVVSLKPGHTVVELFEPDTRATIERTGRRLGSGSHGVLGVITPVDALQLSDNLVKSPTGSITDSIAGKATLDAQARAPAADQAKRLADASETLTRAAKIPAPAQTFDNPEWVKFLLFDNQGNIRKALLPFFPDAQHALIITRLVGNASIVEEGRGSDWATTQTNAMKIPNATVTTAGAAAAPQGDQRLPPGGNAHPRRDRRRHHDLDPVGALQCPVALAPLGHRAGRGDLGIRAGRLSRPSPHPGDDQRPPGHARDRYRLLDPDARAWKKRS